MDEGLRSEVERQVKALLQGGQAHTGFDEVVAGLRPDLRGVRPEKVPYSAWQLLEHLRIAQRDIVDFCTDGQGNGYMAKDWPRDYWPEAAEPPSEDAWPKSVAAVRSDLAEFEALFTAPGADWTTPFPWGEGQTLLREALLIADHTAYHVGELVVLRRLLGAWGR